MRKRKTRTKVADVLAIAAGQKADIDALMLQLNERLHTIQVLERLLEKALSAPRLEPAQTAVVRSSLDMTQTWPATIRPQTTTDASAAVDAIGWIQSQSGVLNPNLHDIPHGAYFFGADKPAPE